jgi:hypothetical protein
MAVSDGAVVPQGAAGSEPGPHEAPGCARGLGGPSGARDATPRVCASARSRRTGPPEGGGSAPHRRPRPSWCPRGGRGRSLLRICRAPSPLRRFPVPLPLTRASAQLTLSDEARGQPFDPPSLPRLATAWDHAARQSRVVTSCCSECSGTLYASPQITEVVCKGGGAPLAASSLPRPP